MGPKGEGQSWKLLFSLMSLYVNGWAINKKWVTRDDDVSLGSTNGHFLPPRNVIL